MLSHLSTLERSLVQLEEMQDIISSSMMGTWRIELPDNGKPRMGADKRMIEILGLDESAIETMSPEEVYEAWFSNVTKDSLPSVLNSVEIMKTEKRDENTYLWVHPKLGERYVRCGGVGHRVDDGYVLRGYHYDVDDIVKEQMKQHEELVVAYAAAEQANRSKTVFLNSMSHDIRTPMNAIIGFTSLAQAHVDNPELVKDYLAKIHMSSEHLLSLINDILDMSRIESGSVKLEEKPLYLPGLIEELNTMMQGLAASKHQHLYVNIKNIKNEDVVADKLRLNQVLLNIISNAIKFTGVGGNIFVSMEEKPCDKECYATYEFSVRDNGIGISKDFIGHVFDSFAREQTSTVSGIQGTGLGLSIAKKIVNMMGGTIDVESEVGEGSTFTITVTLRIANIAVKSKMADGSEVIHDFRGKRVLLVEDNELNREIAQAILTDFGMEVDTVTDGIEAVNVIATQPKDRYDVILMDIQMPKMDGYSATKEIRTLRCNQKANIPIIAMTANAFDEDKRKAYACGMNGHIAKPLKLQEIVDTLGFVLK